VLLISKYSYFFKALFWSLFLSGCSASDAKVTPASLGQITTMDQLSAVANHAGPIRFAKHNAASWAVPLSGMLDLKHAKSKAAGFEDRDEEIQIFVYTIQHPVHGLYLIDSGVSEDFVDANNNPDISFLVEKAMNISTINVSTTTKSLLDRYGDLKGVFLSHIHIDHIMGISDLNPDIPVFIGPGETNSKAFEHIVTRGTTNRLLAGITELREWQFDNNRVVDVFGDGSLWAISSPGHTPGSTAYLVRSTEGPHLIVGDVSHTRWGWDNLVGPGSYSKNPETGMDSLLKLVSLAKKQNMLTVHPGHQE
jgi:glyoxylase-like metal-dependent hydrolase (beta-lactamase superfamily II)